MAVQAKHFGFVFYDFSDTRAIDAIRGMSEIIGDDKLSYFPAGPLNNPRLVALNSREKILDAIHSCQLDAIITLQFWENEAYFSEIVGKYFDCPVIPLLRDYSNAAGVTCPHKPGSYEAVKHLIDVHGCRKPYYLIGAEGVSKNLDERYHGYLSALEDHGIAFTEDMKISLKGTYGEHTITPGVQHHGGEAVKILFEQRQLKVGDDIDSLIVFNDRMALEVIDSLKHLNIRVPQDLKIVSFDNLPEGKSASIPLTTSAIDWRTLGIEGLKLARKTLAGEEVSTTEVHPELIVRNSCGCHTRIDQLITDDGVDIKASEKKELARRFNDTYQQDQIALNLAAETARHSTVLRNAAVMFTKCNDIDSFAKSCTQLLGYLNLDQCSIHLSNPHKLGSFNRHLQWQNRCNDYQYCESEQTLEQLTSFVGKHPVSVCESLEQAGQHMGYLIFGAKDNNFVGFGELRDLFSSTLYSLLLVEDLQRTQAQVQLMQREKLTSLGQLVAGITHDVNTPLGIGVTALSNLVTEVQQLREKFDSGKLGKSAFIAALDGLLETSEIAHKNMERARELIKSFKNISSKNSTDSIQKFPLCQQLHDVSVTMKPRLRGKRINLQLSCPDQLEMQSNPGVLSQILVNLITNSLKHGFDNKTDGNIHIEAAEAENDELLLSYRDDGHGMEQAILDKIFEPFFTTKAESGGTGLGMFMVFNLVTEKLKGRLEISSEPEQGIHIQMYLPLRISE